jgi:hypothetical protein
MECPHCGGIIGSGELAPLLHDAFDDLRHTIVVAGDTPRWLSSMQWQLLLLLRRRFQRCVPEDFLVRGSTLHPEDGGSSSSLKIQLMHLRRALRSTPFAIASFHQQGYGLFWREEVEEKISACGRRTITRMKGAGPYRDIKKRAANS